MIRDRFLKNKCDPFRTENITGRVLYFLQYGIIKPSDINPKMAAGKNSIGRIQSVEDEEEERMMLEFNNSFTSKKTSYDPTLLVGLVAVRDELALVVKEQCGSREDKEERSLLLLAKDHWRDFDRSEDDDDNSS